MWEKKFGVEVSNVKDEVVVSEEVAKMCEWLRELYSDVEWHIRVFGTEEQIDEMRMRFRLEKAILTPQEVSGASVAVSDEEKAAEMITQFERESGLKYLGTIHSHNKMSVFFSKTDEDDLENYTVSLVTNNNGEWYGKTRVETKNYWLIKEAEIHVEGKEEIPEDFKRLAEEMITRKAYKSHAKYDSKNYRYYDPYYDEYEKYAKRGKGEEFYEDFLWKCSECERVLYDSEIKDNDYRCPFCNGNEFVLYDDKKEGIYYA